MRCLLDGGVSRDGKPLLAGTVRGAFTNDETCLVTLDELTERFPRANNCAYYLRTVFDGYLVIDIEKDCPAAEAARLLAIKGALYTETSMSGSGYHVLMPMPKNFRDHPVAMAKRVLRHPEGWWEILLEHWITFTRNPIAPQRLDLLLQLAEASPEPVPSWEELWTEAAFRARASTAAEVSVSVQKPTIPYEDVFLDALIEDGHDRDPSQFDGDLSRFEFSVMGVLHNRLDRVISYMPLPPDAEVDSFDDSARAWLIYQAATRLLPARPKHAELRNDMPFLLDRAVAMIALRRGEAGQTTEKKRRG